MIRVQREMSERAVQLLMLPESDKTPIILDLGCGSGLSGSLLSENGYLWYGMDISPSMLSIASKSNGSLIEIDMGHGVPFQPGMFDGCVSISALQWLLYSHASAHNPYHRLMKLFSTLYVALRPEARAVFQYYPHNKEQLKLILECAYKCGFRGGEIIDYPNSTKKKKHYLCLFTMKAKNVNKAMPAPLQDVHDQIMTARRAQENKQSHDKVKRITKGSKQWITMKKDRDRRRGKEVGHDSKFAGRRRKTAF